MLSLSKTDVKIAVTVDLLTTGIDVPKICNLVFLRRVNSRILYEQMLGRATRRCDEIEKEVFRIFDAVFLYEALSQVSDMKPVVVNPNISFTQLVNELETVTNPDAFPEIVEQLIVKLQRKHKHISNDSKEQIEAIAQMSLPQIVDYLRRNDPKTLAQWFKDKAQIAEILDRRDGGTQPILISSHPDEIRRVERGYGNSNKPEDYLEDFKMFLQENINKIPALLVVTQRPKELTRQQLKELLLQLNTAGYTEKKLQVAWRDMTNEDIAASIIGFIRQAALGDALIPYSERVDKALKKILASQSWTPPQRKWLERIGKQLKVETIVDKEAFDQGQFKEQGGGFIRINQMFNGELEKINVRIWEDMI